MPRQPRQQRLLQNPVPAVLARAAYAPDTTCRMADRTVKQLHELVVGDCILDAFGRYQVITAIEQTNVNEHFRVEAYYVDGVASVDPVTVCVGLGTSLPVTTTVLPTILEQTRRNGTLYRSLNAFQLVEEPGISTEIAVYRSLPPTYHAIRPAQLGEVMDTVNARCNDLLGRILYHQLYSHEYVAYKQKLLAITKRVHMRRAPMRGAIDPATWPARLEMPLSWTDFARAVWLDMPEPCPVFTNDDDGTNWVADLSYLVFLWLADSCRGKTIIYESIPSLVTVTFRTSYHPVTDRENGEMMCISLTGPGDTSIFKKMLVATNLWAAKEYNDVITHMLLVDSEEVRAAAIGGMLDGDGTVYRFEGEVYRSKLGQKAARFVDGQRAEDTPNKDVLVGMQSIARSLGYRSQIYKIKKTSRILWSKSHNAMILHEGWWQDNGITSIAETADDPVHHWVARDNRRALGDRTANVNLGARRFRDHVLFRFVHLPTPAALVCARMRLLNENQQPEILNEVSGTTPPFPLDLPTFMTQDGLVLHGAHPIVGA